MKNEFWQFVSDEGVVKMYERYGLIIVTNWGESKKRFLEVDSAIWKRSSKHYEQRWSDNQRTLDIGFILKSLLRN